MIKSAIEAYGKLKAESSSNMIHFYSVNIFVMGRYKHISKKTCVFSHKSGNNISKPNEFERRVLKLNFH